MRYRLDDDDIVILMIWLRWNISRNPYSAIAQRIEKAALRSLCLYCGLPVKNNINCYLLLF